VTAEPRPYAALLQGVLLTEHDATFMRRAGDDGVASTLWWPPTKIAGRELARHIGGLPAHIHPARSEGVEIIVPVGGE
jgi:sulfide:quinone oxidoreductase